MNIQEIRKQYPMYSDISDQELVDGLHQKFYSDIPKDDFYKTVGFAQTPQVDDVTQGQQIAAVPIEQHVDSLAKKPFLSQVGDVAGGILEQIPAAVGFSGAALSGGLQAAGALVTGGDPAQTFHDALQAGQTYTQPQTDTGNILFKGMGHILDKATTGIAGAPRAVSEGMAVQNIYTTLAEQYKQQNKTQEVPFEVQQALQAQATKMFQQGGGLEAGSPAEKISAASETVGKGLMDAGLMAAAAKGAVGSIKGTAEAVKTYQEAKGASELKKLRESVEAEAAAKKQPQQPMVQQELPLENPNNKFGVDTSKLSVDENGMPINRAASMEAQTTERGGQDLFSAENVQKEDISRNVANWEEPFNPEPGIKQAQIDAAWTERERSRMAEEQAAKARTNASEGTTSGGQGGGRLEPSGTPRINRGTFAQSGALNATAMMEGMRDYNEALSKLTDKIAPYFHSDEVLYRNADNTPKVLLHGTVSNFDAKNIHPMGDLGIHVSDSVVGANVRLNSSLSAIEPNAEGRYFAERADRLSQSQKTDAYSQFLEGQRIFPYVLKSDKIAKASTDYNAWHNLKNVLNHLQRDGIISSKEFAYWDHRNKTDIGSTDSLRMQKFREWLVDKKGIDAIEYPNLHEKIDLAYQKPTSLVILNKKALSPLSTELHSRGGFKSKQGGFIDSDVFVEAVDKLKEFFTERAIARITAPPNYKSKDRIVMMPVDDFLHLAAKGFDKEKFKGVMEKFKTGSKLNDEYIPWLTFDRSQITGHEGRHRVWYMKQRGVEYVPVEIRGQIRWDQQSDPMLFDYREQWPKKLFNQDGRREINFPIPREEATMPNAGVWPTDTPKPDWGPQNNNAFKGGVGKKGFGQGGAVKIPSIADFKRTVEKETGEVSDAVLAAMYARMYPTESNQAKVSKAVAKIPGLNDLNKYESRDPTDITGSIGRMEQVGTTDLDKPVGAAFRNFMPGGRLQAWAMNNPIVHEGVGFITSVKDAYKIKTANMVSELNKGFNYFESKIARFNDASWMDAAEVLRVRRANEFNSEFKPESVFSGKKLELFNEIDKALKTVYEEVNARRKELNPEAKDLPQLPYYFTSYFRGDWQVPIFSESGKFLFNLRENSKANALGAKKWAQENGFDAREPSVRKATRWADRRIDARTDFEQMLDLFGDADVEVQQALTRMVERASKAAAATADMPARFKEKSGRIGSLGDRPWRSDKENFYDNKKALEMYIEGAHEWLANTQISSYAKKMNESEGIKAPNAKSFVNDYADYVTGNKEDLIHTADSIRTGLVEMGAKVPFVGKYVSDSTKLKTGVRNTANVSTGLFTGYFSMRMVAQNVVQPYTATIPKIVELMSVDGIGNPLHATLALAEGTARGLMDSVQMIFNTRVGDTKGIDYKRENHIVGTHLVENSKMVNNFWANQAYDKAANASVALSEQFSRSMAFSIYESYLKQAGIEESRAMDMAKNITHETMGNYEGYAKAQVFGRGGLMGEMSGRLQTFKMNALGQLANYFMKVEAKSPSSWAPLATSLLMVTATAGLMGMIGMDVAELIIDAAKAVDRQRSMPNPELQEFSIKRFIYNNTPTMVSMGALSNYLGVNLGGSFAQNLVGNNPAASVFPVFGNLVEQVQAPANLMSKNSVDKARGLQAFAPVSAKPFIEKAFTSTQRPDGNTEVVSPLSGDPIYNGKGSGWVGHSNIQTLARGKQQFDNTFHKNFSKDVNESKMAIAKSADKMAWDVYKDLGKGMTMQQVQARLQPKIDAYVAAGGDPNQLINGVVQQLTKYGVGDNMKAELMKGFTLGNRKQYQDAARIVGGR